MIGKTKARRARGGRIAAPVRIGSSGAEVQPWYGLTEIDGELATAVYFYRREKRSAFVYDLDFKYRDTPVTAVAGLDEAAVQQAVGHANAWMITTSTSGAGVLRDSTLAGAYGLSPNRVKNRGAENARAHTGAPMLRERWAVDGADSRSMAIMRGIVEDAAHQVLAENVANPAARTRVLIAISAQLEAHARAGRLTVR
jgi:hypothetical protein